jgi:hypothetical protein
MSELCLQVVQRHFGLGITQRENIWLCSWDSNKKTYLENIDLSQQRRIRLIGLGLTLKDRNGKK